MSSLTFPVNADRRKDFESLFNARQPQGLLVHARASGRRRGPWRRIPRAARQPCRPAFWRDPVGLLGYLGSEPVAWCSIAPRSTYRRLVSDDSPDEGSGRSPAFCVRRLRGAGVTKQMLAAALDHAWEQGAKVVEAYPVDADSPSYRFMGFVPMFEEAGFQQVGLEGRRHVMCRNL